MTGEPLGQRALRFGRAIVVGSGATLADFSVFSAAVRLLGVAPESARLPALMIGATVQFFGNRSYTFRAQAGSLRRQAILFVAFEVVTLALNFATFRALLSPLAALPPELVTFLGTFIVFMGFAYPMRRLVIFKVQEIAADKGR